MKVRTQKNDEAVSPVIGVMLMLVVTIIIAAVVSGFAGGLAGGSQKAPAASFEARIVNSGSWGTTMFDIMCKGTDVGIPTKDLKLVTTWTMKNGTVVRTVTTGPSTGSTNNTHYSTYTYHSPLGFGPGVNRTMFSGNYYTDQCYGNYTLVAGTRMHNSAYGWSVAYGGYGVDPSTRFQYTYGTTYTSDAVDGMQATLGPNWNELRVGDVVNVQLLHVPSQKLIYNENIKVEG